MIISVYLKWRTGTRLRTLDPALTTTVVWRRSWLITPLSQARRPAHLISSTTTRRDLLGLAVAASTVAVGGALIAAPAATWDAADWMDRWHRLGCGLSVEGNALSIQGRLNGDRAAIGAMLVEIAPPERQTAVVEKLIRLRAWAKSDVDLALIAVQRIEQIDREFISENDDPAGSAAWLERWDADARKLLWTPAFTSKAIAAKIRYGVSMHSDLGDEIVKRTLAQLEQRA